MTEALSAETLAARDQLVAATLVFDAYGNFEPVKFAKHLLNLYYFKTARDNHTIYVYNPLTGIYMPQGAELIIEEMSRLLDERNRKKFYPDVEFFIHGQTFFDRNKTECKYIACLNGLLDVSTGKLTEFTPDEFVLIQIPVTYDETKECPKIMRFLTEIVGEDQTCMLLQTIGYSLFQATPLHKATMLVGEGANGKSTLIELIKKFLGPDNVASISLQSICENRFATAHLHNKLANLFADLPNKGVTRTGPFKMLVSGDSITAEEKFKPMFTFNNTAKLVFSCNTVPESGDDTVAFWRRWNLIVCNNVFVGPTCKPNILAEITSPDELSGLLNQALKSLSDLLRTNCFCFNPTSDQTRTQMIRRSNSAKAYIEECLEQTTNHEDRIEEAKLYQKYVEWCNRNKLNSRQKREFTMAIHQFLPGAKQTGARIEGTVQHVWQYIAFIEPVATVTTLLFIPNNSEKLVLDQTPVTVATNPQEASV